MAISRPKLEPIKPLQVSDILAYITTRLGEKTGRRPEKSRRIVCYLVVSQENELIS